MPLGPLGRMDLPALLGRVGRQVKKKKFRMNESEFLSKINFYSILLRRMFDSRLLFLEFSLFDY